MPIRINLLAEAQALEELRRRDPVKRAIWVAGFLVALVLIWSISLQARIMRDNSRLKGLEAKSKSQESEYEQVINNQKKLVEIESKRAALRQLATNRFLLANLLNALQTATVDDVQLVRLKLAQDYVLTPEVKPKTNDSRIIPGKPATATEKTTLVLESKDFSARPGEQVSKFKDALVNSPYFQNALGKTNEIKLISLSPPQVAAESGKLHVLFSLEGRFPEKTR
jgi:hypothetical protein